MPFSKGKNRFFFLLEAKKGKTKQKRNKEGLGEVRWSFGPPHLTLKQKQKNNDIISSILDYLDSSRSSNGQHQSINIKQQRQTDIINHAMPDISDTESTSPGLITLDEANIMSSDINMLAVSQPRLPTPTPFDGSSSPFQEWASELRTFLDINGFQDIAQMDIAFREDAPIHLHHLCSGTEIGTTAQDGIQLHLGALDQDSI